MLGEEATNTKFIVLGLTRPTATVSFVLIILTFPSGFEGLVNTIAFVLLLKAFVISSQLKDQS